MNYLKVLFILLTCISVTIQAQVVNKIQKNIENHYSHFDSIYKDLHQHPELSFREFETSKKVANELRRVGMEVTEHFGGNSVVGVLKNGEGPVLMMRADMDALPITEQTGLPYASMIKVIDDQGSEVGVMHACGHDVHMTVALGVAQTMSALKKEWKGTLIIIGQQSEESGGGAIEMIKAGLFEKFPKPESILAFHVSPTLEAGTLGYCPGEAWASVSSVDIIVHGVGGHGAMPDQCIDPVVLSSRIILALQTIVSRELSPVTSAVVTVGSIHGGTKHNIIPDNVKLQLTIRTFTSDVRIQVIGAIKRITKGVAISAGLPEDKYPEVIYSDDVLPPLYNNPDLTLRVSEIFKDVVGEDKLIKIDPAMTAEDFALYGRTKEQIPISMFRLGSVDPVKFAERESIPLPGLHSSYYAPQPELTIKTGVASMSKALIDLFNE